MRIIQIIIGVLMFLGGLVCALSPLSTFSLLPIVIGITMLLEGCICFALWLRARKEKQELSVLFLIHAILSIILGIVLLLSEQLQMSMEITIPIFVASWMLVSGVFRIIDAFQIKGLDKDARRIRGKDQDAKALRAIMRALGRSWWVHLILGILMVIVGAIAASSPFVTALSIGTWMGFEIAFTGLDLIFLPDND